MNLTAGPQPRGARTIIFSLAPPPEPKVQDHIHAKHQNPLGNIPEHGFDQLMSGIVFFLIDIETEIHPEKADMPFIGCQTEGWIFLFESARQGGFPAQGRPQMR